MKKTPPAAANQRGRFLSHQVACMADLLLCAHDTIYGYQVNSCLLPERVPAQIQVICKRMGLGSNMSNNSVSIISKLCTTLDECSELNTDYTLRTIFVDQRINQWQDLVPQADTRKDRVRAVICTFHDRYTLNQENALVLLLHVLAEGYPPNDILHQELLELASELEASLRVLKVVAKAEYIDIESHQQHSEIAPASSLLMFQVNGGYLEFQIHWLLLATLVVVLVLFAGL